MVNNLLSGFLDRSSLSLLPVELRTSRLRSLLTLSDSLALLLPSLERVLLLLLLVLTRTLSTFEALTLAGLPVLVSIVLSFERPLLIDVDDDGSGTVTILEAFRVLLTDSRVSTGQAPNTIEFHWYAGEEGGLLGSGAVFQKYKQDGRQVKAMLNQDMTGYVKPGTTEVVGILTDNVDAGLTAFLKKVVAAVSLCLQFAKPELTVKSTPSSPLLTPSAAMVALTMPPLPAKASPRLWLSSLPLMTAALISTAPLILSTPSTLAMFLSSPRSALDLLMSWVLLLTCKRKLIN
jgi:hypothetical protein